MDTHTETSSYSHAVSSRGAFIEVRIVGEINRETGFRYTRKSHAFGAENGIRRYLVDMTGCRNTDTVTDQYQFAHADMRPQPGIDRGAKVAVLVSPDDHSHDFIETVAKNAGLDITIFRDRESAQRHVLA